MWTWAHDHAWLFTFLAALTLLVVHDVVVGVAETLRKRGGS